MNNQNKILIELCELRYFNKANIHFLLLYHCILINYYNNLLNHCIFCILKIDRTKLHQLAPRHIGGGSFLLYHLNTNVTFYVRTFSNIQIWRNRLKLFLKIRKSNLQSTRTNRFLRIEFISIVPNMCLILI